VRNSIVSPFVTAYDFFLRKQPTVDGKTLGYADRHRSLVKVIVGSGLGMAFWIGTTDAALVGMFRHLGAGPFLIGLLAGITSFSLVLQPVGSWLVARTGSRKRMFVRICLFSRAMWFVIVAGIWLLPPGYGTALTLFGLVLFSRLSEAVASPPWTSWISDLIPDGEQGRFWGRRQMWARGASVVSSLVLNYYLGSDPPMARFIVFFLFLAVCGTVDIWLHRAVHGLILERHETPPSLWQTMRQPLTDPLFRPLLLFGAFFSFGCSLGGAMFHLMMLEEMSLTYFEISIYLAGILGGMTVLSSKLWGRLVDNLAEGPRLVIYATSVAAAIMVFLWPVTPVRGHLLIGVNVLMGGIVWSGWQVAIMALLVATSPQRDRAAYIAMYWVLHGLGGVAGATLSGWLVEAFQGMSYTFGPLILTPIRTVYLLSGIMRGVACVAFLPAVRMPDSRPVGVYIRRIMALSPLSRGTYVYIREKFAENGNGKPVEVEEEIAA
jgi:MFS family permease